MGSACAKTCQTREVRSSNRRNYKKIHHQTSLRNNEYEKVIDSFQLISSSNSSWPELKTLHCKLQQVQATTRSQKSSVRDLKEDMAGIWESINTSELMQGLEDEEQPQGQLNDQVGIKKFVCEACGGLCLFPCVTCNGSCKILGEGRTPEGSFSVCRCPDCNEDGLIQCPLCSKF